MIGKKILLKRTELGMSQAKLAELAKVRPATISEIENNPNVDPQDSTISAIAQALGTTFEELTGLAPKASDIKANKDHITAELAQRHLDFMRTNYLAATEIERPKIIEAIRMIYPGKLGDVFIDYCKKKE
jgi:transcriptional regulator with XRE-family HTH domain